MRDLAVELTRQADWVVEQSGLRSRRELAGWMAPLLTDDAAEVLRRVMPLEHPKQKQAEEHLCEFFQMGDKPKRRHRTRSRVVRPTRAVDWGESYARANWNPPLEFVEHQSTSQVDRPVLAALVGQLEKWCRIHRSWTVASERLEALEGVLEEVSVDSRHQMEALDRRKLDRLRRVNPELAEILETTLRLWRGDSADEYQREAFRKALAEAVEREDEVLENENHLLEVLVLWVVARAAVENRHGRDWSLASDAVQFSADETTARQIRLERDDGLRCLLGMTKPARMFGVSGARMPTLDRTVALREAHGASATAGYQPDLTLRFTHPDSAGAVFAFADAKNYEDSDLAAPIKSTATAYLYAYAPLCGSPPDRGSPFEFETAVRPAVTLFTRKQGGKVAGVDGTDVDGMVRLFEGQPEQLPSIVLFGDRHFFGSGAKEADNDKWRAPVVEAWFACLARDAASALQDGRGVELDEVLYDSDSARPL